MENLNLPKDLEEKLKQAIKSDKYFINISCDIGGPKNMQHYWITRNFPKDRIVPSLEYFKDDISNKELRDTKKKWE